MNDETTILHYLAHVPYPRIIGLITFDGIPTWIWKNELLSSMFQMPDLSLRYEISGLIYRQEHHVDLGI